MTTSSSLQPPSQSRPSSPLGLHRVIDPPGVLPQAAWRLDTDPAINPDAATWGYMSMILSIQYGLMLNLSHEVILVRTEMSQIWLRGLRAPTS